MGIENFLAFIITATLFIMTPGIDTMFMLNTSIGYGKKAGIYAALGIGTGVLVHTVFAALGLSLIIAKSAIAFATVKYLGAAYLLYLGITKLLSKTQVTYNGKQQKTGKQVRHHCVAGLVTNVLNPKVALFFLAFFPGFIRPGFMDTPMPFIVLGLTYALLGAGWFVLLSLFAAVFAEKFTGNEKLSQRLSHLSGIVFILMGLKMALSKR